MKSVKLLGFLLGLMLVASKLHAADPTPPEERAAASKYAVSYSSVNVGSMTAVAVAPAGTGYRSITLSNFKPDLSSNGTTMFYRIDGLTTGTTIWGRVLLPNTEVSVETQNSVRVQLATNASSTTVRVQVRQK